MSLPPLQLPGQLAGSGLIPGQGGGGGPVCRRQWGRRRRLPGDSLQTRGLLAGGLGRLALTLARDLGGEPWASTTSIRSQWRSAPMRAPAADQVTGTHSQARASRNPWPGWLGWAATCQDQALQATTSRLPTSRAGLRPRPTSTPNTWMTRPRDRPWGRWAVTWCGYLVDGGAPGGTEEEREEEGGQGEVEDGGVQLRGGRGRGEDGGEGGGEGEVGRGECR